MFHYLNMGLNFNTLNEKILASRPFVYVPGGDLTAVVIVKGIP